MFSPTMLNWCKKKIYIYANPSLNEEWEFLRDIVTVVDWRERQSQTSPVGVSTIGIVSEERKHVVVARTTRPSEKTRRNKSLLREELPLLECAIGVHSNEIRRAPELQNLDYSTKNMK